MENQLSKVVVKYIKRILFGLITIEFIVIDRRPDFKQYHHLRKFLHVTSVYVVGLKVFETEVISFLIGNVKTGFCLEKDAIDVLPQNLNPEYVQMYSNQT